MTINTAKVTVSLDPGTLNAARTAAAESHQSLSAWLDQAARESIRRHGAAALADFMASPEGDELREWTAATAAGRATMPDLAA